MTPAPDPDVAGLLERITAAIGARDPAAAAALIRDLRAADPGEAERVVGLLAAALAEAAGPGGDEAGTPGLLGLQPKVRAGQSVRSGLSSSLVAAIFDWFVPSAVSAHILLIAAIFVSYFGCMAALLAYIARTGRPDTPEDGGGDRDEDGAGMLAA